MSRKSTKKTTKTNTGAATQRGRGRKKIVTLAQYEAEAQAQQAEPVTETVTMVKDDAVNAAMTAVADDKKKRASGLDAVARVLREAGTPLTTGDMVKVAIEKGYWATGGKTPAATIYSAIVREISIKGEASRFRKTERGHFELTEVGKQDQ